MDFICLNVEYKNIQTTNNYYKTTGRFSIRYYFNHKFFGGTKLLSKNFDSLTLATKTPITAVASSGPEDPAAMKVAPATSGGKFNTILK